MRANDPTGVSPPSPASRDALPEGARDPYPLAVHEAAHAVVATATGYGEVHSVTIEGDFGYHGRSLDRSLNRQFFPDLTFSDRGRDYLKAAAFVSAAGPVAQALIGEPCSTWQYHVEADRDGDEPDEGSDYHLVTLLAGLLEWSIDEVWAKAERFVRKPEVWDAVEAVAQALVTLREGGEPGTLDAGAYVAAIGPRLPALQALAFTSLDEAINAAKYG